ncbi:MAG: hypothetical protein Q7R45_02945, partial [Sulfuricaulis sp.]|nr:hypothetical protein [Sulfuricaulis sp.]
MALTNVKPVDERRNSSVKSNGEIDSSSHHAGAVSWSAILAGAATAAALSLILLILGTGLGLSSVSPWANAGIGAAAFGVTTILWVTATQVAVSGLGGYMAGRLRSNWTGALPDEIYFRDTAHGFLAWAVASLATAALLTTAVGAILNSGIQAGASMAGGVAATAGSATVAGSAMAKSDGDNGPLGYFVDSLFRKDASASVSGGSRTGNRTASADVAGQGSAASLSEVTRIFMYTSRTEPLPPDDVHHVGRIVAQRTGLSQADAEARVTETYIRFQEKLRAMETAAKEAADKARKVSAYAA